MESIPIRGLQLHAIGVLRLSPTAENKAITGIVAGLRILQPTEAGFQCYGLKTPGQRSTAQALFVHFHEHWMKLKSGGPSGDFLYEATMKVVSTDFGEVC